MAHRLAAESTPVIAIAQKGIATPKAAENFIERHAPLMRRLEDLGAIAIGLNGAEDRTEGRRFARYYRAPQEARLVAVEASIDVDAARCLTGGVARYTAVPALNPVELRDLAASKHGQYDVLKDVLDNALPQTVYAAPEVSAVSDAIDTIESSRVVVKPDKDPNKRSPILIGSKDEVRGRLGEMIESLGSDDRVVVQSFLDELHADFAPGLKLRDQADHELYHHSRHFGRELRVHLIDEDPVVVHGRVGLDAVNKSPGDEWVFFDHESIPQYVLDTARLAAQALRTAAGARNSYLAVDLTPDGRRYVETNGRNIGTMKPSSERPGADYAHKQITNALATKLVAMSQQEKGI